MVQRQDYVALDWVKSEIDETLLQARGVLESFVENTEDVAQLRFCLMHIHQVSGTLHMVQFFGAALLGEEMEQFCEAIVDASIAPSEDNLSLLMQGILQLPTYLERVKVAKKDLPAVLLPLINQFRKVRGAPGLTEVVFFKPDFRPLFSDLRDVDYRRFDDPRFIELIRKLRQMYQMALIGLLRGEDLQKNWTYTLKVVDKLADVTKGTPAGQLWLFCAGLVEGLSEGNIAFNIESKKLLKSLESLLRLLSEGKSTRLHDRPDYDLLRHILFLVSESPATSPRIQRVREAMGMTLPDTESVSDAAVAPDKETMASVVAALLEELVQVKDSLDILVRGKVYDLQSLSALIPSIKYIADTMAVVGLSVPQRMLIEQVTVLNNVIASDEAPDDATLMSVAGAILYVEASLASSLTRKGIYGLNDSASPRLEGAFEAVIHEARNGLEQSKDAITEFINSQFDQKFLRAVPSTLISISGGLQMIQLTKAAAVLRACVGYVNDKLITGQHKPDWEELDVLADALMGVEYYLERITQDGQNTSDKWLEQAKTSIEKLGYRLTEGASSKAPEVPQSEAVNAEAVEATEVESDTQDTGPDVDAEGADPSDALSNDRLEPEQTESSKAEAETEIEAAEPLTEEGSGPESLDSESLHADVPSSTAEAEEDSESESTDTETTDADQIAFETGESERFAVAAIEPELVETEAAASLSTDRGQEADTDANAEAEATESASTDTDATDADQIEFEAGESEQYAAETVEPELVETEAIVSESTDRRQEAEAGAKEDAEPTEFEAEAIEFESTNTEATNADQIEIDTQALESSEPEPLGDAQAEPEVVGPDMQASATPDSVADVQPAEDEVGQPAEPDAVVAEDDDSDLIDDEIIEIFLEEAAEVLETIAEFLPQFVRNEDDTEALTEVRRAFHTLKGSGRMVGASVPAELAWAIENMLNRLIDGTVGRSHDMMSVLDQVVALLPDLVEDFRQQRTPDRPEVARLTHMAEQIAKGTWQGEVVEVESLVPVVDAVPVPEVDEQDEGEDLVATLPAESVLYDTDDDGLLILNEEDAEVDLDNLEALAETTQTDDAQSDDDDAIILELSDDDSDDNARALEAYAAEDEVDWDDALARRLLIDEESSEADDAPSEDAPESLVEAEPVSEILSGSDLDTERQSESHLLVDDLAEPVTFDASEEDSIDLLAVDAPEADQELAPAPEPELETEPDPEPEPETDLYREPELASPAASEQGLDAEVELASALGADSDPANESAFASEPEQASNQEPEQKQETGALADDSLGLTTTETSEDDDHAWLLDTDETDSDPVSDAVISADQSSDDSALEDMQVEDEGEADDLDATLIAIFKSELEIHLQQVENNLNNDFLANPDVKIRGSLQRTLNTIQGSAQAANFTEIAQVSLAAELLVKDCIARGYNMDEEVAGCLRNMVVFIRSALDAPTGDELSRDCQNVLAAIYIVHQHKLVQTDADHQSGNDVMGLFMSANMDVILDAEHIVSQWHAEGHSSEDITLLTRGLHELAVSADRVRLRPVSQLSDALIEFYHNLDNASSPADASCYAVALEAQEQLINMIDRLAAGQSLQFANQVEGQLAEKKAWLIEQEAQAAQVHATNLAELESLGSSDVQWVSIDTDPDLLEIFLDEAQDLLETILMDYQKWKSEPTAHRVIGALQRSLHTMKGGARMANIAPIGNLSHELETLYEGLYEGRFEASHDMFVLVEKCHDTLGDMIDDVINEGHCRSSDPQVAMITAYVHQLLSSQGGDDHDIEGLDDLQRILGSEDEVTSADVIPLTPEQLPASQPGTMDSRSRETPDAEPQVVKASSTPASGAPEAAVDAATDVDPDILEIFLDEANELLHDLDSLIHSWQDAPDNDDVGDSLKRVLHTLKGGARLSKLTVLGNKSHEFETYVIQYLRDYGKPNEQFFDEIIRLNDELVACLEQVEQGLAAQAQAPVEEAPVASVETEQVAEPEPSVIPQGSQDIQVRPEQARDTVNRAAENKKLRKAKERARGNQPQETVKVSASLLESLVNLAGETSITRSRLEQEVSDFGHTLVDMEATIDRLRDQVRRLDIETEEQMVFRQERAEESNYVDFDPLEMDRYSSMQQLSRSLMEAASDLYDFKGSLADKARDAETILLQQARINTQLHEGLMQTRMVPFNRLVPRLRRIVRQISDETHKNVDLVIHHADAELDRAVLEHMVSPLEHILRNAVDHGIEMPSDRTASGKSAKGRIDLTLSREAGEAVITIADDGAGINVEKVRKKALERGLIHKDQAISDQEVLQFILSSGFTTAERVTQISGRGVGMDVVHSEVRTLGGTINIDTESGVGTNFVIRLPVNVSVSRALMVNLGEDLYAIPLDSIEGIVRVPAQDIGLYLDENGPAYTYADTQYRVQYLGELLGASRSAGIQAVGQAVPLILAKQAKGKQGSVAFYVDNLMGSREIVVKPLGPQFSEVRSLSGATILGDGSVVVILDLLAMLRLDMTIGQKSAADMKQVTKQDKRVTKVLIVDDSVTVRKVTSRLLDRNGMEPKTAKDGADAILMLQEYQPDLILLDIEMPRMDGFEVAQRVRHDPNTQDIPIIMITSRTGDKHRERALSIGVNAYMGKPFQEGPLLAKIKELTDKDKAE